MKVIRGTKKDTIIKHFSRCLEIVQQFGICDAGMLSHEKIKIIAITSCIISLKYLSILPNGKKIISWWCWNDLMLTMLLGIKKSS